MKLSTVLSSILGKKPSPPPADKALAAWDAKALLGLLCRAVQQEGLDVSEGPECLTLSSGIELRVSGLDSSLTEQGTLRTVTRIDASHPIFFPKGLPEYQYSYATSVEGAVTSGFSNWACTDLVALQDAVVAQPAHCTSIEMKFPVDGAEAQRTRRVVFGPTGHYVSVAPQHAEEHPFCPCCLLTQNLEVFRSVLESDETVGIRLFASRDENGDVAADCRLNGDDFLEGAEQLKNYAQSWPPVAGLEFRKQYVIVQSVPASESAPVPSTMEQ
jgi:hypothetical protein